MSLPQTVLWWIKRDSELINDLNEWKCNVCARFSDLRGRVGLLRKLSNNGLFSRSRQFDVAWWRTARSASSSISTRLVENVLSYLVCPLILLSLSIAEHDGIGVRPSVLQDVLDRVPHHKNNGRGPVPIDCVCCSRLWYSGGRCDGDAFADGLTS